MKILNGMKRHLSSFSDFIPMKKFLIYSEFILILILMTALLFPEYFTLALTSSVIFLLGTILITSFILLFTKHEFTIIAFFAVLFVIAGSSIMSFFLELSLAKGSIHSLEIIFTLNAGLIVFIGTKLIKYQYDIVDVKSLLLLGWSFSILYISYVPVFGLGLSRASLGYGLVTSLIFGGIFSAATSLFYLRILSDENYSSTTGKKNDKDSSQSEVFEYPDAHYEKINKLRRD